jgi:hypothetical protein
MEHYINGTFNLEKKEIKALQTILAHAEKDYGYHLGGSYGDGENVVDKADYKIAPLGFETLRFIIKHI